MTQGIVMNKIRMTKVALLSLVTFHLSLISSSCSSIDCPIQNTVYTVYKLYDGDGSEMKLADTIYVLSSSAKGDTLLLNSGVGLSTINLPISYDHPEDTLVFLRTDTAGHWTIDTVWVEKSNIPHFESVDCSAAFFHELTGVRYTRRGIDSIVIHHPTVNYDPSTEHFHFYPKPSI